MAVKISTREEYLKRIDITISYINNNLGEDLQLAHLAQIANFSPFHFHRIMKAFLGESLGIFVSRTRLEAAARLLRDTGDPVKDIAFAVGYNTPSSLTNAFRNIYNVAPIEYRNNKTIVITIPQRPKYLPDLKNPKIITAPDKSALSIRIMGEYGNPEYATAWPKLWEIVKKQKLFTAGIEHLGICYDDPGIMNVDKIRYDACLVIHKQAQAQDGVGITNIAGGRFAVFLHLGPYNRLSDTYDAIYQKWLPDSGFELRNDPSLEKYINNPGKVNPEKLKTEILIPING